GAPTAAPRPVAPAAVTGVGPRPAGAPTAAPRPPPAAPPPGDLSDDYIRRIEKTLSETRKKIGDSTQTSFDTLKSQLSKQVPTIKQQHGAKSVEFQVVVKDGKAVLKAVPKK
ncbi:MAG: hypothetical protein HY904_24060, partial [Deltaproteobacteria bacterium]|nr:hypothetical protein [Deltaproteobacteria bacterium]